MKATGIVRRIDDLGRVVIPKEIRRAKGIEDGDPLEIFVDNNGAILLRHFKPSTERNNVLEWLDNALAEAKNDKDRESIIQAISFVRKG
ncbi:stage V sporulation protein T [Bacillus pakistanensis]|uniref:Stage V sporulation protein T n=1 Tax=Rossellomorea pakistanensis TaxID=992288 RepID=A0ABS2NDJ0_9BACI|nr:stage V sporulation protein T [Bacillus pakistanensis]